MNEQIYLLNIPVGEKLGFSTGKIKEICEDKYSLKYFCSNETNNSKRR